MSEMKPLLLDSELPEDLASVLRSAEVDGPEDHEPAQSRALAAVAAHRAASTNGAGRRTSAGMPLAKTMLALAVACAGGAALFSTFGSSGTHQAAPARVLASAVPPAPQPLDESAPPAPAAPEGVRIDDLPAAPVDPPAAKPAAARTTSIARGAEDAIQDELAIIDAARASLAAKRPEATLARVETYRRRFQSGHFNEEADVLEIQALVAMGRRAEAEAKGERFLASHPASAYTRRAQSALASEVTP